MKLASHAMSIVTLKEISIADDFSPFMYTPIDAVYL